VANDENAGGGQVPLPHTIANHHCSKYLLVTRNHSEALGELVAMVAYCDARYDDGLAYPGYTGSQL
jgi:hypothetical protein